MESSKASHPGSESLDRGVTAPRRGLNDDELKLHKVMYPASQWQAEQKSLHYGSGVPTWDVSIDGFFSEFLLLSSKAEV